MWFDILKNVKQSSRQLINLDWDDETVPEEEESDCLKKLKEYYDKAKSHPYARKVDEFSRLTGSKGHFNFIPIPEEVACAVIQRIESAKRDKTKLRRNTMNIDGVEYLYTVTYGVFEPQSRPRYQIFRVEVFYIAKGGPDDDYYEEGRKLRFATYSRDLDADIDFRKT